MTIHTMLITVAVALVLGSAAPAAAKTDREKEINKYERIAKKAFCICRESQYEGRAGRLLFLIDTQIGVACQLPNYTQQGQYFGASYCYDYYDIVGP